MDENKIQDDIRNVRNFSIIAHINHGKSTLADRFLELTGTVEKRKMKEQYLDQMDLERERGITIKLQPVRMEFEFPISNSQFLNKSQISNPKLEIRNSDLEITGSKFTLNLIDTPGHIDFSYEVSRALKAVEGAVLLVDATQGVQAQTFTNAELAKLFGLAIIPVVNKIDLPGARIRETKDEIMNILNCDEGDILEVSAKTGEGVERLLKEIIIRIPPPKNSEVESSGSLSIGRQGPQALIFDFNYSLHRGVIAYIRMMKGEIKKGDELFLAQVKEKFIASEVGFFHPEMREEKTLGRGDIGYVITNIKKPATVRVGDTIVSLKDPTLPLSGYEVPKPVVWVGIYPESQNDFNLLSQALERLHLSDSSLSFEEEGSGILGRGFKCGFLGMLHVEIVAERLKREFNLKLIMAAPSVVYSVRYRNGRTDEVYSAVRLPDDNQAEKIFEPWIEMKIITPNESLSPILKILQKHDGDIDAVDQFGSSRIFFKAKMPLREFMKHFFDEMKSVSEGYASLSYKMSEMREANISRLDVLVAGERIPAFSRVVKKTQALSEGKELVEKLKRILPRALFAVKIQAQFSGRIIASQTLSALKKDVTGYLYGGDRTRKMKLWKKQQAGKRRLKERGRINIPHEVFLKMITP